MSKPKCDVDFYWICACCDCKYLASQARVYVDPYPACPACGEEEDVFRADTWNIKDDEREKDSWGTWLWKADHPFALARHAKG